VQDAVQTLILLEVFKGGRERSQGTRSIRKRAGPDSSDAAMKRKRKKETSAQDVSSCGAPVHGMRQNLYQSLPFFSGGLTQHHQGCCIIFYGDSSYGDACW
jgi:hypothetical protein